MLKVSAFYLEKQKSFIPKKIFFGRCQYQNKKALFTDSIFQKVLVPPSFLIVDKVIVGSSPALWPGHVFSSRAACCASVSGGSVVLAGTAGTHTGWAAQENNTCSQL